MKLSRVSLYPAVAAIGIATLPWYSIGAEEPAQGLYITDPMRAMIYAKPLDSGPGRPVPFSGKVQVSAENAIFIGSGDVVFTPTGVEELYYLQAAGGSPRLIAPPPGQRVLSMRPGLQPGEFSLLTHDGTTKLSVALYRQTGPEGTWEYAIHDLGMSVGMSSVTNEYLTLTRPAALEDKPAAAFIIGLGSQRDLHVKDESGELVLHATVPRGRLIKGPDDLFAFVPDLQTETSRIAVYDSSGNELTEHPLETANVATSPTVTLLWREQPPVLSGIRRGIADLLSHVTSLTEEPEVLYSSYDEAGLYRVGEGLSGAGVLHHEDGDWYMHDRVSSFLNRIDIDTQTINPALHYTYGEGPAFVLIEAIAMGPDGYLYVLDEGKRIIRVNMETGDREVVLRFSKYNVAQRLEIAPDGKLFLAATVEISRETQILQADIAEEPLQLSIVANLPNSFPPKDFRLMPDGSIVVLFQATDHYTLARVSGGEVTTLFPVTEAESLETIQAEMSGYTGYRGTVSFDSIANIDAMTVVLRAIPGTDPLLSVSPRLLVLEDPEGVTYEADIAMRTTEPVPDGDTTQVVLKWTVNLSNVPVNIEGNWKADALFHTPSWTEPTHFESMSFRPRTVSRSQVIAPVTDSAETIATMNHFPPRFVTMNTTTGELQWLPIQVNGETQGMTSPLNRVYDILLGPDGKYFISLYDQSQVYVLDPATGEAELWIPGKPVQFTRRYLGEYDTSMPALAVGPYQMLQDGGWVVVGN